VKLPKPLTNSYAFAREVAADYSRDNGGLISAAISFYVFLSLIPVLLLAVSIGAYLLGSPQRAEHVLFSYISQYSPVAAGEGIGIRETIAEIVRGRGTATGVGAVVLLWTSSAALGNLERAINVAWNTTARRGFFGRNLVGLIVLVLSAALLLTSLGITAFIKAARALDINVLGARPATWPWLWGFLSWIVPLAATIAAFTLIYKVLPNARVRLRVALLGGVFAGLLFEIAKFGFGYYVAHFASYSHIYGSLGGAMLLLVWINYSSTTAILGAEVASLWDTRKGAQQADD